LRKTVIVSALFLLFLFQFNPPCSAASSRTLGVGLSAGFLKSISGSYDGSLEMNEALETGYSYGIELERWIGDHFRASMVFGLSWMRFKETASGVEGEDPCFTVPALMFRNSYHFTTGRIRPFISAGAGLYFWKFNSSGPLGAVMRFEGERLQKMSIGLLGGVGLEVAVSDNISVIIEPVYHYILSKDRFIFGEGFSEQGMMSFSLALHYYLKQGGR